MKYCNFYKKNRCKITFYIIKSFYFKDKLKKLAGKRKKR